MLFISRSLLSQLKSLQSLVAKSTNKAAQASTCVMVSNHVIILLGSCTKLLGVQFDNIPCFHQERGCCWNFNMVVLQAYLTSGFAVNYYLR